MPGNGSIFWFQALDTSGSLGPAADSLSVEVQPLRDHKTVTKVIPEPCREEQAGFLHFLHAGINTFFTTYSVKKSFCTYYTCWLGFQEQGVTVNSVSPLIEFPHF